MSGGDPIQLRKENFLKKIIRLEVEKKSLLVTSSILAVDSLLSMERLDRASPELWPEQIPGVNDFPSRPTHTKVPEWMGELDDEDNRLLLTLSTMSVQGLVTEVKKLYDAAYQVGCDESKEMTRGKYLKVLEKKKEQNGQENGGNPR